MHCASNNHSAGAALAVEAWRRQTGLGRDCDVVNDSDDDNEDDRMWVDTDAIRLAGAI
jgi:hypothetical protein